MNERLNPLRGLLQKVALSGSYNDLTDKPTTMKNPQALKAGTKTYDGSSAVTVTADDLGALPTTGGTVTGTLVLSKTQDSSGTTDTQPALIVGGTHTTAHIQMDNNEINAKANGTTVAQLNLNTDGGLVNVGKGGITTSGAVTATGGFNGNLTGTASGNLPVFGNGAKGYDFNGFKQYGIYQVQGTQAQVLHAPIYPGGSAHFHILVLYHSDTWLKQIAWEVASCRTFVRNLGAGVWSSWYEYNMTAVTADQPLPGPEIMDDYTQNTDQEETTYDSSGESGLDSPRGAGLPGKEEQ